MRNPRLILLSSDNSEREFRLTGSASIGRASDNLVHIRDEMVSLYHAVIEERRGGPGGEGGFWLSDLGSVYGTTVNGRPIKADHRLRDGDLISIGGAAILRYSEDDTIGRQPGAIARFWSKGPSPVAIAALAAVGLIVVVVILVVVKLVGGGDCEDVRIVSLSPGTVISKPVRVQTEARNPQCVKSVSYRIDGRPFARPSADLFEATLDPGALKEKFPDLTNGDHELSIAIETDSRRSEVVADSLQVRIEFPEAGGEISLREIHEMAQRLAARINQRGEIFVFADEFLKRVRSATEAFRTDVIADAERVGPDIRSFSNRVGLPAQLMFLLAASRSRFNEGQVVAGCGADPSGVGVFKIPRSIIAQFGKGTAVDHETVTEVAARHVRDLLGGRRDDFFYAVACFGESTQRVGEILQRHDQQARRDFQSVVDKGDIKPEELSRVVCFFAAGIVAENPQRFGINTKSLADIY